MQPCHFDIVSHFMKWYCQHSAACEPTSLAMLLSAGHFSSMQGLLKHWLEQQSFHSLLMQPCLSDIMTILGQASLALHPWPIRLLVSHTSLLRLTLCLTCFTPPLLDLQFLQLLRPLQQLPIRPLHHLQLISIPSPRLELLLRPLRAYCCMGNTLIQLQVCPPAHLADANRSHCPAVNGPSARCNATRPNAVWPLAPSCTCPATRAPARQNVAHAYSQGFFSAATSHCKQPSGS